MLHRRNKVIRVRKRVNNDHFNSCMNYSFKAQCQVEEIAEESLSTHTQNSKNTLKEVAKGHALNQRCNRMHSLTQLYPNSLKRANVLIIIPVLAGAPLLDRLYGGHTTFNGRLSLHPAHMAVLNHPSFLFLL